MNEQEISAAVARALAMLQTTVGRLVTGRDSEGSEGESIRGRLTPELVFAVVEEALLASGLPVQTAREVAGVIQLILDVPPRPPPGMSQQDALRRLVRIHLTDILGDPRPR